MTIKQLLKECEKQIKNGNGDKEIWLSNDDEGNGYHCCYYAFSTDVESLSLYDDFEKGDNEKKIVLG